jgi:hypothetical protein
MDCKKKETDSCSYRLTAKPSSLDLSNNGKQLFRQYDRFDDHSFIEYIEGEKEI